MGSEEWGVRSGEWGVGVGVGAGVVAAVVAAVEGATTKFLLPTVAAVLLCLASAPLALGRFQRGLRRRWLYGSGTNDDLGFIAV